MYLYIIRHGHPVYGPEERLTEIGHKQAKALVPRMVQSGITKIYSSPLRRARETAQPTAEALGLPVQIEDWMSEDLAWRRFARRDENDKIKTWMFYTDTVSSFLDEECRCAGDDWCDLPIMKEMPYGKEGWKGLMAESDEFLARHGYVREGNKYRIEHHNDERIAAFCHQGFGLTWLSHLLRIPTNVVWAEFDMTHTGVTVLHFDHYDCGYTVPKMLCLSDMSHIFASDECDYQYHTSFQI